MIRAFARDQLRVDDAEARAVADRHLTLFADLAVAGSAGLQSPEFHEWMPRILPEWGNLRAAWLHAIDAEEWDRSVDIARCAFVCMWVLGRLRELAPLIDATLAHDQLGRGRPRPSAPRRRAGGLRGRRLREVRSLSERVRVAPRGRRGRLARGGRRALSGLPGGGPMGHGRVRSCVDRGRDAAPRRRRSLDARILSRHSRRAELHHRRFRDSVRPSNRRPSPLASRAATTCSPCRPRSSW